MLCNSQTDGNTELENHDLPTSTTSTANPPRQDTIRLPEYGDRRTSSVESPDTSEDDIPQNLHATAPDTSASNLQGCPSHESTTHLAPLAAQEASSPSNPVLVSSARISQLPHEGNGGAPGMRRAPRSLRDIFMPWKFELIAALLAVTILVCEVIILAHYDGKFLIFHSPHDWKNQCRLRIFDHLSGSSDSVLCGCLYRIIEMVLNNIDWTGSKLLLRLVSLLGP